VLRCARCGKIIEPGTPWDLGTSTARVTSSIGGRNIGNATGQRRPTRCAASLAFGEWLNYDHVWYRRSGLPERKGSPCCVVARSTRLGSVLVEFQDGFRVVTSRYAVRRG
jgi:hypothetical protein